MDESLQTLMNDTQNNNKEEYYIELSLTEEDRKYYSLIIFIFTIILNLINISIISIPTNIIINVLYYLCICSIFMLTLKKNDIITSLNINYIILIILFIISIIFDFIISSENNHNTKLMILVFLVKNVILILYFINNIQIHHLIQ
jgi:hypothetical protein